MIVENAIIMAAGTSSRFVPLSFEHHKAMIVVNGEILIERQIKQLKNAGIKDIYIVTGYKACQFDYLVSDYGVKLIYNKEFLTRNNNGSIWAARNVIANSYVCSADNYFTVNPFEKHVEESYYAAEYSDGDTDEWCMAEDEEGYISSVVIGGSNAWYMLGHTFWSQSFSDIFLSILDKEYDAMETRGKLWESIFMEHLDVLKMKIKKYEPGAIYEFDTLDELRKFDRSYIYDTRSAILKNIAERMEIEEKDIVHIKPKKDNAAEVIGFEFDIPSGHFIYIYENSEIKK